jgi:serine/threonine protein kinase
MADSPSHPTFPADSDLSGRRLGDYQVLRRLGRGGMADVYLATQISLQRQVAFKVLRGELAHDEAYVRRFHNEARAAAALVHANIVQIHEVGCIDGSHFIAQEYVAGQNLKQWLIRHRTADAATAVHVMRQVVAALQRASQQGIIHRDIKPENIMLARTGEVKVADFGLARVLADGQSANLTQVGITMGSPLYMSPEQVEGNQVDPRSDLYSLGVTCYEMLAGRPPFEGETTLSVAVQHLKKEPPRLEHRRADIPEGLCRIVHKLLAKLPRDRYQNPSELMRELRALHIEGLENWSSAVEEWDTPELLALADGRSEMTQRLDAVISSQAMVTHERTSIWRNAALLVAAIAIGAAAAWLTRPDDLLAVTEPAVVKKETSFDAYWYALSVNTEQAWLEVAKFPQNKPVNLYYARRAKQRLAEWYRDHDRPNEAMQLYVELSELAEKHPLMAAGGYIGQANLFAQQGDMDSAEMKLAAAIVLLNELPGDQQMEVVQLVDGELADRFRKLSQDFRSEPNVNDR